MANNGNRVPRGAVRGTTTAAVLLFALAGCSSGSIGGSGGGGKLTSEWQLHSISTGENLLLSSLKGKTLFINIWATWCPPCVAELPSIARLRDQFEGDPNVVFLLVSVDNDPATVEDFLRSRNMSLPVYVGKSPPPAELHSDYVPATFIVDPTGVIRKSHIGGEEWDRAEIVTMLKSISKTGTAAN